MRSGAVRKRVDVARIHLWSASLKKMQLGVVKVKNSATLLILLEVNLHRIQGGLPIQKLDEMEHSLRDAGTAHHVDELMKRHEKSIGSIKASMSDLDRARLSYIRNMAEYRKNWLIYRDYMST